MVTDLPHYFPVVVWTLLSQKEVCKTHFGVRKISDVPLHKCDSFRTFTQSYYDLNGALLDKNYWLRMSGSELSLKCVAPEMCKMDDNQYILYYEEYKGRDEISTKLKTLDLSIDDILSSDNIIGSFKVHRYEWKNDITIDVCEFGPNDFYVIGTFNPYHPGKIEIDGTYNVNSKITEYLVKHKPNINLKGIRPKVSAVKEYTHYKSYPILLTSFKCKPPFMIEMETNEREKNEKLLNYIPKNFKIKHAGKFAMIYLRDGKKKVLIFSNYNDAVNSKEYKDENNLIGIVQIPDDSGKDDDVFLDNLTLGTRENDNRNAFVNVKLSHGGHDDEETPCLIDTGSSFD